MGSKLCKNHRDRVLEYQSQGMSEVSAIIKAYEENTEDNRYSLLSPEYEYAMMMKKSDC
jgi:hypothetical protein